MPSSLFISPPFLSLLQRMSPARGASAVSPARVYVPLSMSLITPNIGLLDGVSGGGGGGSGKSCSSLRPIEYELDHTQHCIGLGGGDNTPSGGLVTSKSYSSLRPIEYELDHTQHRHRQSCWEPPRWHWQQRRLGMTSRCHLIHVVNHFCPRNSLTTCQWTVVAWPNSTAHKTL
jgi:hypothetical protein